ncbi:hypothetical protein H5410_031664, partial [Solanum commersonii]
MEQSACRRAVLRSSIIPPNDPGCEDAKAEDALHAASGCPRETHLIRVPWDFTLTLGWVTLLLYDRRHLHWKLCLNY